MLWGAADRIGRDIPPTARASVLTPRDCARSVGSYIGGSRRALKPFAGIQSEDLIQPAQNSPWPPEFARMALVLRVDGLRSASPPSVNLVCESAAGQALPDKMFAYGLETGLFTMLQHLAHALSAGGVILGGAIIALADERLSVPPLPALTRAPAAAVSPFGLVLPEPSESVPTPAAEPQPPSSGETGAGTAPNASVTLTAAAPSSRESYEEISARYPPPAHSLVPQSLEAGPRFWGAGSRGGAWADGTHLRYPYYNARSPWTYGGPAATNHTIHW